MVEFSPGSIGLLNPIQQWLDDNEVTEILINQPREVWIEKRGQMSCFKVDKLTEKNLLRLFQLIANENQQTLNRTQPIFSGNLITGERVQLCLPPISLHPTLSIRKQCTRKITLQDYQDQGFFDQVNLNTDIESEKQLQRFYQEEKWLSFISTAIKCKKNIVISGGTSSGKTTFLNACLQLIDKKDRLLLLEDTRELNAPQGNQVSLLAAKGGQSINQVTMQALVQCCLRLRPDRIIMGEIRGREMLDFISACSTGHEGSITSLHANSTSMAFSRMTQLIKLNNVPSMTDNEILNSIKQVIDIVIQLKKTPQGRKLTEIYYKHY